MPRLCMLVCVCLSVICLSSLAACSMQPAQFDLRGGPRALVSVLEGSSNSIIAGLGALAKSALRHTPRYFVATHLLVFNHVKYNDSILEAARVAGWTLEWLNVPQPFQHGAAQKLWAKTSLWAMTTFHEVVFMEPGTIFVGPLRGPFTTPATHHGVPSGCGVWAGRTFSNGTWQDTMLDAAVLGVRPDMEQHKRLQSMLLQHVGLASPIDATAGVQATGHMETLLFNAAFKKDNGSWCALELGKNMHADALVHQQSKGEDVSRVQVVQFARSLARECAGNRVMNMRPVCNMWYAEASSNSWPVTVVTAFFKGPNKHKPGAYDQWGRNFMGQKNVPLVVVTDNASAVPAVGLRPARLTHIIEVRLGDFVVAQHADDIWDKQQAINPHKHIQSTFLFKVWLEKTNNVKRAIGANPFNSSHYVWVDYGCFRNPTYWGTGWRLHRERFATHNRMIMLNQPGRAASPVQHVGGTIFGGSVRAWDHWSSIFYKQLRSELLDGKHFVGDDQNMMSLIVQTHPHLVCVVQQQPGVQNDPWFYLQDYLAGTAPWEVACKQQLQALHASTQHLRARQVG